MFKNIFLLTIFCCSLERISSETRHHAVVDFVPDGNNFKGKIHVKGYLHELSLKKPETSVFSPNFRLTTTGAGPDGEPIIDDVTPAHVSELENNIYEDEDANAVFTVEHVNGEMRLHGILDNMHISHDGENHFAIVREDSAIWNQRTSDYIPVGGTWEPDNSVDLRQAISATPEVFVSVDYKMWLDLGRNSSYTTTYLAILFRGINNRYRTITNISIKYKIVNSTIFTSRTAQPFVEKGKNATSGQYNMDIVLDAFAQYMYNRTDRTTKVYDLEPLLSGENYGNVAGLAWLGGACQDGWNGNGNRISWRTSVSVDARAAWIGIHTIAHELAHNMGSPHDGQSSQGNPPYDTTDCPWTTGYIMTYTFNSTTSLKFSDCSIKYMKNFISSTQGACVKSDQFSTSRAEAPQDPGAYMNMTVQCQKRENRTDAKPFRNSSPDDLCGELVCEWPTSGGIAYRPQGAGALDGTPCGTAGGKCTEGKCK